MIKLPLSFTSVWRVTVEFAVESGFLQDSLKEIRDRAGVAGAVFKLGAMAIPEGKLKVVAATTRGPDA